MPRTGGNRRDVPVPATGMPSQNFFAGLTSLGATCDPRQPVTAEGLKKFFPHLRLSQWEDLRAKAFLSVAYCGAFRKFEWTNIRWKRGCMILQAYLQGFICPQRKAY